MEPKSEIDQESAESVDATERKKGSARATSYDVARRAGVSQSTVSRVFRDGASVSKSTRKKVEAAAAALNYSPSLVARSLITQRSNMIAVIITDPSNRAYPEILFYLGQKIQQTGNRMLVFALPHESEADEQAGQILAYHVDGIISSAQLGQTFLESCNAANVPVVLFNRTPPSALASAVSCDHAVGMDMLVRYLDQGEMGHIALLAGPETAPVSNARLAGAMAALARLGKSHDAPIHSDYTFDGGRQSARALLAGRPPPHTIICANDAMALGVMDACRFELGLSVPGDVAVTGFDDIPQADWPSHSLTTLRQPIRRMAETTVRLLMDQINGDTISGERRLLPAELKLRGSTRVRT
ncbi:MAG: LacI family transcriptional regulator [Pararhodobacter sp.]|nr:LacI family transcriptional regulator [Pararhodobacter sp.]